MIDAFGRLVDTDKDPKETIYYGQKYIFLKPGHASGPQFDGKVYQEHFFHSVVT